MRQPGACPREFTLTDVPQTVRCVCVIASDAVGCHLMDSFQCHHAHLTEEEPEVQGSETPSGRQASGRNEESLLDSLPHGA